MNGTQITRSDDLRVENRHRILQSLRNEGPLSRVEVGKMTGLSQGALSTLLGLMAEEGIVSSESHSNKNKRGRPQTTVALRPEAGMAVSVSLAVDTLTVTAFDYAGTVLSQNEHSIDSTSLDIRQFNKVVTSSIKKVVTKHADQTLKAISIGFQGVTNTQRGELVWSPILSIENVPIAATLKNKFSVPVSVNNDCGLIAAALHQTEKKKLGVSFAAILFSHGIGLGVYLAGKPFNGAHSSALEIGHVQFEKNGSACRCGKLGCIEAYAADYGIQRLARGLSDDQFATGKISDEQLRSISEDAKKGDANAINAFTMAGHAIGSGLATVFALLDPIPVALVGHNSDAFNLMQPQIETALTHVGRSSADWSHLLHCYHDDAPLLQSGLILDAMALMDREFAVNANPISEESAPA